MRVVLFAVGCMPLLGAASVVKILQRWGLTGEQLTFAYNRAARHDRVEEGAAVEDYGLARADAQVLGGGREQVRRVEPAQGFGRRVGRAAVADAPEVCRRVQRTHLFSKLRV
jgi:hypothetical protein